MIVNNGGSAFPIPETKYCGGLSIRDWFAGQALNDAAAPLEGSKEDVAKWCYLMADAMIAERVKQRGV